MSEPAIDAAAFANLVEMTGGDVAFVNELVDTYLEDGAAQVTALRDAVTADSTEDLVRPAHSMKSSSLNVGALPLGALCRELEEAARSGPVPDASGRVAAIAAAFEDVRTALLAQRSKRGSA